MPAAGSVETPDRPRWEIAWAGLFTLLLWLRLQAPSNTLVNTSLQTRALIFVEWNESRPEGMLWFILIAKAGLTAKRV